MLCGYYQEICNDWSKVCCVSDYFFEINKNYNDGKVYYLVFGLLIVLFYFLYGCIVEVIFLFFDFYFL